ncbi:MAG: Rho termination factor N-terminal domain-containing protein, partial [Phycisphaeraceae bacterium]|nr:Rho termination factor N-terminal domain-containing protein [Phycisphaeraceae bacterium]
MAESKTPAKRGRKPAASKAAAAAAATPEVETQEVVADPMPETPAPASTPAAESSAEATAPPTRNARLGIAPPSASAAREFFRDPNSDEQLEAETQRRYDEAKVPDFSLQQLQKMAVEELHKIAEEQGVKAYQGLKKQDLIFKILQHTSTKQGLMYGEGTLEILPDGFGFL